MAAAPTTDAGLRPRFLTADLPGVGGEIKRRPEDFLVDEQPLYEPCGEGEHVYLCIQKRGMTTSQVVGVLARHFGVRAGAVGYAGLKDKHAITRQIFSVHGPGKKPEDFPDLVHERLATLWVDRHTNKLRPGHLRGNRFSIRIRNVDMTRAPAAKRILDRLSATGVPNLAGEQRFGSRANNHALGRLDLLGRHQELIDLLLGPDPAYPRNMPEAREAYARSDYASALEHCPPVARTERNVLRALRNGAPPDRALRAVDETQRRFWISAYQSAIFNRVLCGRMDAGTFDRLLAGDLAQKHINGAVFIVDDEVLADPGTPERVRSFEISPSGPMWGLKMARAGGAVDAMECAALEETGVTLEDIAAFAERSRQPVTGARRPLRVPLIDPEVEGGIDEHGHYVRCAFELPAGAFATIVMREVMKPSVEATDDDGDSDAATE